MSILPPKRKSIRTGLNILDLGNSSREQVILVKIILRHVNVTYAQLWEAVQKLPERQRLSRPVFDDTLQGLVDGKWLWKTGSGEQAMYSPRLQQRVSRVRLQAQMSLGPASASSSFSTMWDLLEQRAAIDEGAVTDAQPTRPAVTAHISNWISSLVGTQQVIVLLVCTLAVFAFASSTLGLIGNSGFLSSLGPQNMPWLWIIETVLGFLSSTIYIRFADRVPRVRLVKWMLSGLAITYLMAIALFAASTSFQVFANLAFTLNQDKPQALVYPLIYLINALQCILFPMAFWNLANSLYASMSEARRVFPLIAAGGTAGGLVGSLFFTKLFSGQALLNSDQAPLLLGVNAGLLLLLLLFAEAILKERDLDHDEAAEGYNLLGQIHAGLETIREIPLFRYLGLVIMLSRMAFCFMIYHMIFSMATFSQTQPKGSLDNLFGWFGIANTLLPLVLQWRVVSFFTQRVDTKDSFIALPVVQFLSLGVMIFLPHNLYPAMLGPLVAFSIAASWDSPVLNTLQNLIPEERRAQINTLLTQYSFVVGQVSGCGLLVVFLFLAPLFNLEANNFYLPLGLLASLGAILAAIAVSHSYTNSMLSWRVARRHRSAGVLDKLDF